MRTRPLRSRVGISTVLASAITGFIAFIVTGAAPSVALASHAVTSIMPHT